MDLFGDFGFAGGSDETADPYQDAQRCINFYPEVSPSRGAKMPVALLGTPGLTQLAAAPGGGAPGFSSSMTSWPQPSSVTNLPVRGSWVLPGYQTALAVIANICYLVTQASPGVLTLTQVGTLGTATGPVNMRDNGTTGGFVLIVDGTYGYLYSLTGHAVKTSFQALVTAGSKIVTLTAQVPLGIVISNTATLTDTGALVPAGTTIVSIDYSAGTVTLSQAITGTAIPFSGSITYGSATLHAVSLPGGVTVGAPITDASGYIPADTTISAIAGDVVTLSAVTNGPPLVLGVLYNADPYVQCPTGIPSWVQVGATITDNTGFIPGSTTIVSLDLVDNFIQMSTAATGGNGSYSNLTISISEGFTVSTAAGTSDTLTQTIPVWTQLTDPGFLGASSVAVIDGWWILNKPATQTFFTNSQPYALNFNPTYYAQKDAASDNLMTVIENKEELWLIGERTAEIWYDAGGAYFPFQRLVGTLLQVGCKAAQSVCQLSQGGDDSLIWFARSVQGENIIVRTRGFGWQVVSTPAVSNAIAQYATTGDAIGYVCQQDTHVFYVLTFPTADRTWVYDATLPPELAWHERLSYDPYAAQWHRHRSNCYMNFAGASVVGDYQNGALYSLTRSAHTDAGWPLRSVRRSPYIWNAQSRERVFMQQLQVDFRLGQGNASGMGSAPTAALRISRDYGATYGAPVTAPMGAQGQFTNRCIWRKLGFSRGAVAEIEVIDPVNRDIAGATLRAAGP